MTVIRANFPGLKIIARGVSGDDHPDLSVDELIKIILTTGTDRHGADRRTGNGTGTDSSTLITSRRRYSA